MKPNDLGRGADRAGWLVRADWHEERGEGDEAALWRAAADALEALHYFAGPLAVGHDGEVRIGDYLMRYVVCRSEIYLNRGTWHIPIKSLRRADPRYLRRKAFEIARCAAVGTRRIPGTAPAVVTDMPQPEAGAPGVPAAPTREGEDQDG